MPFIPVNGSFNWIMMVAQHYRTVTRESQNFRFQGFPVTAMSDPRFARLKSDPRFRRPKKQESKVVVDDRFKAVFASKKNKKGKSQSG